MPKAEPGVPWVTSPVVLVDGRVRPVGVVNPLRRPLGLEIELCRIGDVDAHRDDAPCAYSRTRDSSVNGDQAELVLPPLAGDKFVKTLGDFAKFLARWGAGVDNSCGMHVHVGANDFGYFELRRLLTMMWRVEPDLYRIVAPGRGDVEGLNRQRRRCYCVPLLEAPTMPALLASLRRAKSTSDIKSLLLAWMYAVTTPRNQKSLSPGARTATERILANAQAIAGKKNHKYELCRYYGLNLHSWMMRGTVEFRHHEGTLAVDRLILWPLMCGWLVEAATRLTDHEAEALTGLRELVDTQWKRPLGCQWEVPPSIREWVHRNLRAE